MKYVETWRDIQEFEGLYQVSSLGRVYSAKANKILKYGYGGKQNKYPRVTLYKAGKRYRRYVHRLVWNSFNGEIPNGFEINHKDENTKNPCLDNLELLTHKENVNYGTCRIRTIAHTDFSRCRALRPFGKEKKPIAQYQPSGKLISKFPSIMQAAKVTNIPQPNISKAIHGKRKTAGTYVWKLVGTGDRP